jgi:hypothetical protein
MSVADGGGHPTTSTATVAVISPNLSAKKGRARDFAAW